MKLLLAILLATAITARADAVRMQINGPDGQPVAGAQVRVQEWSGRWIEPKYEVPLDLVSDENGSVGWESKFSLARKPDDGLGRSNQALVRVSAPGLIGGAILKAGENVVVLAPTKTLQGVVKDENQQPLAGATLKVSSLSWPAKDGQPDGAQFLSLLGALALETVSDAQGNWRLENMPVQATARLEVAAPGFQKFEFATPTAQDAPPIFLRRGATVKGRILRPDGTGAADVQFFAGDAWKQPRTDADGHFEVSGIKPGRVTLQITSDAERLPFILPYKAVQGLVAGEVRDVGDWQADKGVRVRGRIVGGTNKPIAKAQVSVWGAGDGSGLADANGEFDFVAQKGASMATVSATGYISKNLRDVADAKNGVVDLGAITLKSARKVKGVLKNQAGAPVPNIYLRATQNGNDAGGARSDAKGEFTFDTLDVGTYTIRSYNGKIVEGERFTVAATDNPPLAVTIQGKAATLTRGVPLQARVVDENGAPVAGAQVALRLETDERGYSSFSAISDDKGALSADIRGAGSNLKISEVFRPGYNAGAGNNLRLEGGAWRGEIRLQARGQFLRGRVLNVAGVPLAGIAVALNSGADLPVETNDNGEFALPDAPQSGAMILASDGARFAAFKVEKAGQPIEISLPDAAPVDKEALADAIAPRAWWEWGLMDNWDAFGAARMEEIAFGLRRDANDSWTWNQFLQELARREPARFVARENELRANNTQNNDEEFDNAARLAFAASGSAQQKSEVRDWLTTQQKIKRETTADNVTALLTRAEIAAGLGDAKQTQTWLDYAAQIGDYVPNRGEQAWDWGRMLAAIAPDAALKFVENWTPVGQMQLLQSALTASTKRNDESAVRADWEQIQKLAVAAETGPPDDKTRVEGFVVKASDLLRQATGEYAQFLSRTDPQSAFELAQTLASDDYERAQAMPVIGKNAARLSQFDVAKSALKASFESSLSNTEWGASAAQIAATFDEKLADDLFARLALNGRPNAGDETAPSSLNTYAAARADKWPGQTRVLIEREWPACLKNALKTRGADENGFDESDYLPARLIGAIALVSPARALEMAEQLPARKPLQGRAFAALLTALLAPKN